MTNFFTSDNHFFHANIIKYCNRPFNSVEEMNETMIANWNSVVKQNDTIYHLGDFGFASTDKLVAILKRLNGKKYFIMGNHDKQMRDPAIRGYFVETTNYKEICIRNKVKVVLCHYPFASWNGSFHGSIHCHGHTHGKYSGNGKILDVGVDCHDFTPISYEQIEEHMKAVITYQNQPDY